VPAAGAALEPGLADRLQKSVAETVRRQEMLGETATLLVPPPLRPWLARFVQHAAPGMRVLAYTEIPDNRRVKLVSSLGR